MTYRVNEIKNTQWPNTWNPTNDTGLLSFLKQIYSILSANSSIFMPHTVIIHMHSDRACLLQTRTSVLKGI